eukprot:m.45521 g.45521  ORF g.45521 m.45521 type:complete len:511 (+) comp7226_c0_seq1:288-1820(+)
MTAFLLGYENVVEAIRNAISIGGNEMSPAEVFNTPREVFLNDNHEMSTENFIGAELLDGVFKISSYLFGGAFGQGWRAEVKLTDSAEHGDIFIKTMRCEDDIILRGMETETEISQRRRAKHEAIRKEIQVVADERIAKMDHPNIATPLVMYGNARIRGEVDVKMFFIVSELCAAGMLCEYLVFRNADGPRGATSFCEHTARYFVRQLVEGVAFMHDNKMTHRDLKLENLVLTDTFQLKIIDFGSAKFDSDAVTTATGVKTKTILGTDIMFPPELQVNTRYYNPRAMDVWCVGVITFFLIGMEHLRENGLDFDFFTQIISRRGRFQGWLSVENRIDGVPQNLTFWGNLIGLEISDTLKHFLNSIFDLEPDTRATVDELRDHDWLLEEDPPQEEIEDAMTARRTRATVRERVVDLPGSHEFVELCANSDRNAEDVIQMCILKIYSIYTEEYLPDVNYGNAMYEVISEDVVFFTVEIDDYSLRCHWHEGTLSNWLNFVHGIQRELQKEYEEMS